MYPPHFTAPELAAIARVIHGWRVEPTDGCLTPPMDDIRRDLAITFADALAKTNSLFDRERFMRAALTGVNRRS